MSPREPPSKSASSTASSSSTPTDEDDYVTILGFGSLLSESSSRMTFPKLANFRLGRVLNYKRVFGHPASIFFQRGIAKGLEMSSLCAEPCDQAGFVCSVFEVPNDEMMQDSGVPSMAFLEREEEFDICTVPFVDLHDDQVIKRGILCTKSTDETYLKKWGKERFYKHYGQYGVDTIWGWKQDSGLKPCAIYLRHCVLAAKGLDEQCYESFLDETYLVDRITTIRQYLEQNPQVMKTEPPPELALRYGG